jgi:hypothetical protein
MHSSDPSEYVADLYSADSERHLVAWPTSDLLETSGVAGRLAERAHCQVLQ